MSAEPQLTFAGEEVDAGEAVERSRTALHPTARGILTLARRPEGVTATEAGRLVHAGRDDYRHRFDHAPGKPCCPWCSTDGSAALVRLAHGGYVRRRTPRGPYHAVVRT